MTYLRSTKLPNVKECDATEAQL